MEAHLAPKQPIKVNKITSSCEIRSGPHNTQYCMENPEQAFVDYASSHTDEAGGKWYTFKPEQNNLGDTYNPSWKSHPNLMEDVGDVMFSEISKKYDDSREEELEEDENAMTGGVVKFTDRTNEIAYKMPYKIEQYNSLSDLEKEHTKSVYFRNEEDKRRGVDHVMSKILEFYKECLELGPEYLTGLEDEGGVTKFFQENKREIFIVSGDGVGIFPDGVTPPDLLYLMRRNPEVLRKFQEDDSWMTI
ncbi:hypothetical protein Tco_0758477 [Tanacetum coccineum]